MRTASNHGCMPRKARRQAASTTSSTGRAHPQIRRLHITARPPINYKRGTTWCQELDYYFPAMENVKEAKKWAGLGKRRLSLDARLSEDGFLNAR
eukprot:6207782-Pleurochrysis_carterae.AAC.2